MKRRYTDEDLNMIEYFYDEKDDVTRYISWDEVKDSVFEDYPGLAQAMADLQSAEKRMDYEIALLGDKDKE